MQMHAQFLAPVEPQQRIVVVEVISGDVCPQTAVAQQAQHPEIDNGAAEIWCAECQARSDLRPSAFSHFFSRIEFRRVQVKWSCVNDRRIKLTRFSRKFFDRSLCSRFI